MPPQFKELLLENNLLSKSSIILVEMSNSLGLEIAKKLKVKFNGIWKEMGKMVFTDVEKTKSTFTAKDFNEAQQKLKNMRLKFGVNFA